ncbi:rhomboid family intramembrane serine protease [Croceimicrobium hydrocarbonivorans]|uniref:Rhomboid family intramembrane serine protease n=1 Tax=Croceimicrobium hydrocarbonivorans TaxID=2761580 RepID=A0A7H0VFY3_9FLAO|nr:rhomboid family intramembrane serine protease [Croceimicrobium hydrocarbonivorans]QNR24631.1 rhomboid family intramembrane serine protease [Croceimicrobium hydrocarbonivorans]
MNSAWDQIKYQYRSGGALNQLIMINLAVFILYLILNVLSFLFQINISGLFISFMALPSDLGTLATRPWTLITYMFLHQGFWHIFSNLIWLYLFGRIFLEYFGGRRLIATYLLGGLIGGAFYVLSYNIFPVFAQAVAESTNRGASAGVMAVVFGIAIYNPRYPIRILILSIPLWGVAAFALLMDLIALGEGNNAGGHLAHIAGAAFGYFMAKSYGSGRDLTAGLSSLLDRLANLFKPKPKLRKVYSKGNSKSTSSPKSSGKRGDEERLNHILEKINRSGYDSLSKDEKDHLFKFGKD